jgi:hypothetical protein
MIADPCAITSDAYERGEHWLKKINVPQWESDRDNNEWDSIFGTIAISEMAAGYSSR